MPSLLSFVLLLGALSQHHTANGSALTDCIRCRMKCNSGFSSRDATVNGSEVVDPGNQLECDQDRHDYRYEAKKDCSANEREAKYDCFRDLLETDYITKKETPDDVPRSCNMAGSDRPPPSELEASIECFRFRLGAKYNCPAYQQEMLYDCCKGRLSENRCYRIGNARKRIECIQDQLYETFGNLFRTCPNAAETIAVLRCKDCPWDPPSHGHPPFAQSCAIASFIARYSNQHYRWEFVPPHDETYYVEEIAQSGIRLSRMIFILPTAIASIILSLLPGITFLIRDREPGSWLVIRTKRWHEPLKLLLMWLLFDVAVVLLGFSATFFSVCEANVGIWLHRIIYETAYGTMLIYTASRFLRLTGSEREDSSSWLSFSLAPFIKRPSSARRTMRCAASLLTVVILTLLLPVVWVREHFQTVKAVDLCRLGATNIFPGLAQYAKRGLELAAIVVYSIGPPQQPYHIITWRAAILFVILGMTLALTALEWKHGWYVFPGTAIPQLMDFEIAGRLVEVSRMYSAHHSFQTAYPSYTPH